MGPIALSAFEIYQQQIKQRMKKKAKRIKKQSLQQQLSVSGLNGSPNGSSILNGRVRKVEFGTKPQGIVKAKAKTLKRLKQRPARQLPKKQRESFSPTTNDTSADISFESPANTFFNSPVKKARDDFGKEANSNSGQKAKINFGMEDYSVKKAKKTKDGSSKKTKDGSSKKAKDGSSKKAKDGSSKTAKDDSGKTAKDDSGKTAKDDSGKTAKDDSGKTAKDDSGKTAKDDSGKKAKDDSAMKARDDSGKEAKDDCDNEAKIGERKPFNFPKRCVIEDDSVSEEEETPPKQTEKRKRNDSENEVGKIPKFLVDEDIPVENSTRCGREVLQWLLTPVLIPAFLEKYWEQRPLYISRSFHRDFFNGILSSEDIDTALRENSLQFTKNIDVTSYVDGVRETHNPVGRAHAFTVWDYYRNGCSVRILNPQTYFKKLRKICTSLQECFNSFVGANVYLTPPNSQGFAPHYDDIEAFVLQLEGKKKWKVYQPRKGEKLPRVSSRNFTEKEMKEPLLEVELQPGDLLYMPRGFIHQACTVPGTHSLHVTISTYQHSSWADVMEKVTSAALAAAIENDAEFREGVPWDFLHNTGLVFSTDENPKRKQIQDKIQRLFTKLIDHAPIDAAADQMAKEFIHESLPPMLHSSEVSLSVHGDVVQMKDGDVGHLKQLTMEHSVKLVRRNVLRMVSEADEDGEEDEDTLTIYHCAENSLVYKEDDIKCCKIHVDSALAIETLIRNYPRYTRIADLPAEDNDQKMVMCLWERGILISEEPVTDVSHIED